MGDFDYLISPMYDNYLYDAYNTPRSNLRYAIPPTRENMAAYPWLFMDELGLKDKTKTNSEKNEQPKTQDIDHIKKYLKADSVVKPITKANDGKFSVGEAFRNFRKGIISPITFLMSSKENAIIGGSMVVGAAALGILCPPAGVVMAALGFYGTAATVGTGVVQLATAKNGDDVEKAAGTFGLATFEGVTSFFGAKSTLKYGVAKGGVKVGGLDATGAEAVEAVNKMGFTKAALKTMDPRTVGSAIKQMFTKAPKERIITAGVTPKPPKDGDANVNTKPNHPIDPDDIISPETIDKIQTPPPPKDETVPPGLRRNAEIVDNNTPQKLIGQSTDNNPITPLEKAERAVGKGEPEIIETEAIPINKGNNNEEKSKYYYRTFKDRDGIPQKDNVIYLEDRSNQIQATPDKTKLLGTDINPDGLPNNYKNAEVEMKYIKSMKEDLSKLNEQYAKISNDPKVPDAEKNALFEQIKKLNDRIAVSEENYNTSWGFFDEHLEVLTPEEEAAIIAKNRGGFGAMSDDAAGFAGFADDVAANADNAPFTSDDFANAFAQNIEGTDANVANVMDDAVRIADDAANVGTGNKTMTLEELERIQSANSQPIPENFDLNNPNPFINQSGQVLNNIDNTVPPQNGAVTGEISGQDFANHIDDLFGSSEPIKTEKTGILTSKTEIATNNKLQNIQAQTARMKKTVDDLKTQINMIDNNIDNAPNQDIAWDLIQERHNLATQLREAESDLKNFYHSVIESRERIKPIKMQSEAPAVKNDKPVVTGNDIAQHIDEVFNNNKETTPTGEDIIKRLREFFDGNIDG